MNNIYYLNCSIKSLNLWFYGTIAKYEGNFIAASNKRKIDSAH